MTDEFKAIVVVERLSTLAARDARLAYSRRTVAYVFERFSAALDFMRNNKPQSVIVEFGVENETIDFYDAARALDIPVVFSANRLDVSALAQFGVAVSGTSYPEREQLSARFDDHRSQSGLRLALSDINRIAKSASLDA